MTDSSTVPPESAATESVVRLLRRWTYQGFRTALFQTPRWNGLNTNPFIVAGLVLLTLVVTILLQRLFIDGEARFYWQAIGAGWLAMALSAWACYVIAGERDSSSDAPGVAQLLTMVLAQALSLTIGSAAYYLALMKSSFYSEEAMGAVGVWIAWAAPGLWTVAAQIALLWRGGSRKRGRVVVMALTLMLGMVATYSIRQAEFWYPDEKDDEPAHKSLHLTQEIMEGQPEILDQQLNDIQAHQKGHARLYGVTFAPYSDEVFRKESAVVAQVIERRFDARGRMLQLLNNADTAERLPWATPLNLQRAIDRFAEVMDREHDVLFIHLTSHGARDGELATHFVPLRLDSLTPKTLKAMLDDAGILNRVISVSACYSGSWIDTLADDNTLIMTAADAEHTSYGCGYKSELTYFGRAMYDEQMRTGAADFESAFKKARVIIERREKEAGKEDGFSNPQIRIGKNIGDRLGRLEKSQGS